MKSNYKPIGKYIRLVDERNAGLKIPTLLGLSISKEFIPSVANIIGSDMENYKIIRRNQFACSLMQVRRDKKMPVALLKEMDEAIISQAYPVFEVINPEILLPEYLMMWFTRPEFDREACFYAVGGVRGGLEWEDLCNMQLPVPALEKQKEIVKEYHTIVNRINLNEQLNQKLEETARAIYKQWFVDFEFPDENGNPYKLSGGEMVDCAALEKEIPLKWRLVSLSEFCGEMKSGGTPNRATSAFWNSRDVPWLKTGEVCNNVVIDSEEYISHTGLNASSAKLFPVNTILIAMYGDGKTKGQVGFLRFPSTTNQACCGMICNSVQHATYLFYHLLCNRDKIVSIAIGGAQENLSKTIIENLKILLPDEYIFNLHPFTTLLTHVESLTRLTSKLLIMKNLLLQKMVTLT